MPPCVLLIAGDDTANVVTDVCSSLGVRVKRFGTAAQAVMALQTAEPWLAVVAALGTDKATCIFEDAHHSALLAGAKAICARGKSQAKRVIVFSHTACRHTPTGNACRGAGADDVIANAQALHRILSVHLQLPEEYPPIKAYQYDDASRKRLLAQLQCMPRSLTLPALDPHERVRFICVSDTHHHHSRLALPPGEVLLHTGDFIGNYGKQDIERHLADFGDWITECGRNFKLVILVAGNHDTLLDCECYHRSDLKEKFLSSLPGNVVYLQHTGVDYRGIKIWGSPTTPSRQERLGKRYYSDAFERTVSQRTVLYEGLPEATDILMTHTPPRDILSKRGLGDECLTARLKTMHTPPKFHVFGHDHDYFGVATTADDETICINAAQEGLLRRYRDSNGCPLVFDLQVGK